MSGSERADNLIEASDSAPLVLDHQAHPHILDTVLSHCDTGTLATCLRLSTLTSERAARYLFQEIRVEPPSEGPLRGWGPRVHASPGTDSCRLGHFNHTTCDYPLNIDIRRSITDTSDACSPHHGECALARWLNPKHIVHIFQDADNRDLACILRGRQRRYSAWTAHKEITICTIGVLPELPDMSLVHGWEGIGALRPGGSWAQFDREDLTTSIFTRINQLTFVHLPTNPKRLIPYYGCLDIYVNRICQYLRVPELKIRIVNSEMIRDNSLGGSRPGSDGSQSIYSRIQSVLDRERRPTDINRVSLVPLEEYISSQAGIQALGRTRCESFVKKRPISAHGQAGGADDGLQAGMEVFENTFCEGFEESEVLFDIRTQSLIQTLRGG